MNYHARYTGVLFLSYTASCRLIEVYEPVFFQPFVYLLSVGKPAFKLKVEGARMIHMTEVAKFVRYDIVDKQGFAAQQVHRQAYSTLYRVDAAPPCEHIFCRYAEFAGSKQRQQFFEALAEKRVGGFL